MGESFTGLQDSWGGSTGVRESSTGLQESWEGSKGSGGSESESREGEDSTDEPTDQFCSS
jgi:hypothetical protein